MGLGPRSVRRLAPPTAVAAILLLGATTADLRRHLRDALDPVERAYAVAFFDAARFGLLCR